MASISGLAPIHHIETGKISVSVYAHKEEGAGRTYELVVREEGGQEIRRPAVTDNYSVSPPWFRITLDDKSMIEVSFTPSDPRAARKGLVTIQFMNAEHRVARAGDAPSHYALEMYKGRVQRVIERWIQDNKPVPNAAGVLERVTDAKGRPCGIETHIHAVGGSEYRVRRTAFRRLGLFRCMEEVWVRNSRAVWNPRELASVVEPLTPKTRWILRRRYSVGGPIMRRLVKAFFLRYADLPNTRRWLLTDDSGKAAGFTNVMPRRLVRTLPAAPKGPQS